MALSDEITHFQQQLEACRRGLDDTDEDELLAQDLIKARAAVETAWLERLAAGMPNQRVMPEERHGANSERPTFGPIETIGLTTSMGVW